MGTFIDVLIIIHRIGTILPLEQIRAGSPVASAHRHDAFEACRYLIDYLKDRRAVLEEGANQRGARSGSSSRAGDEQARARPWERDRPRK